MSPRDGQPPAQRVDPSPRDGRAGPGFHPDEGDGSGEIREILDPYAAAALTQHIFGKVAITKYVRLALLFFPAGYGWPETWIRIPLSDALWTPVAQDTDKYGIVYYYTTNTTDIVFPPIPAGPPTWPGNETEDPEEYRVQYYLLMLGETADGYDDDNPAWQFVFELNPAIVMKPGDSPHAIKAGGLRIRIGGSGRVDPTATNIGLAGALFNQMLRAGSAAVVTSWYINVGTMINQVYDPSGEFLVGGNFQPVQAAGYVRSTYAGTWENNFSSVLNNHPVTFQFAQADWGTVTHYTIENLAGDVAFIGMLPFPINVRNGYRLVLPARGISAAIG